MEENWDVSENGTDLFEEEELPLKDPKQWESIKETAL